MFHKDVVAYMIKNLPSSRIVKSLGVKMVLFLKYNDSGGVGVGSIFWKIS